MSVPTLRFKQDDGRNFLEWADIKISELNLYISDGNYGEQYPTSAQMVSSGVPFIRANNIKDQKLVWDDMKFITPDHHKILTSGHLLLKDILITTRGEIGTVALVQDEFEGSNINAQICLLRVNDTNQLDPEFLLQELTTSHCQKQFKELQTGSALKQLPKSSLGKVLIKLPCVGEQTKIANFLTAVDEKITQLTQKHDLLTQYKKGVMQQIFSQELRFKDDDGKDFPDWGNSTLEDVSINYYQGINTAADKVEYVDGGVPIIQAKHITGEYLDFSDARGLSQSDYDKYKKKYNPKVSDLLISNIGTLGKVVLVEAEINFLVAWNIFKVTLNTDKCYPKFIRDFLKKIASDGYFDSIKTGNATKFINKSDMLAIEIVFPCLREQTKIANFLTTIDEKITNAQFQLEAAKQYKQGLLQQMFV